MKSYKIYEDQEHSRIIYVEGGSFLLGDKIECEIRDFWIGQYAVSQELWRKVMGYNPSRFKGKNLPIENISWNDVQLFLKKLNSKLELRDDQRFRLPTETEWEYAARGGLYAQGTTYSGSNDVSKVAFFDKNNDREPQQLGLKVPNELGFYDLSGNIFEWCQDWYDSYPAGPLKNPRGPEKGEHCVLRGGSWFNYEGYCRVSYRNDIPPDFCLGYLGFRLSRSVC